MRVFILIVVLMLLEFSPAGAEFGFDEKYERDYNIFNPINQFRPDNPLNPSQVVDPNNPFNPINKFDPDNPLNPVNRFNPNVPFKPLDAFPDRQW